jgi:hypothetical protein
MADPAGHGSRRTPPSGATSGTRKVPHKFSRELQAHDVERPGERLRLHVDMNRAVLIGPRTELVLWGFRAAWRGKPRATPGLASASGSLRQPIVNSDAP